MGDLAEDTRVEGGDGRYAARLSRDWEIWGPNGGYLASVALRAAGAEAEIPRPVSFTAQFLRTARFDAVEIEVTAPRRGRRSEALCVSIEQDGKPVLVAQLRTAAVVPGYEHDVVPAPEAPAAASIDAWDGRGDHPFWRNIETRWVEPPPESFDERNEGASFPPRRVSWHRFVPRARFDDPFLEAARSLVLLDTMTWPAAHLPHPQRSFIAPNLDVSAWFHRAPGSEWLLSDQQCPVAESGLMGTRGRVFDETGRLVASGGAQLYCVPAPPES